jgi:hypothetical protein
MNSEYNDFAIGFSTIDTCLLSKFLKLDSYIISVYNDQDDFRIEPKWCPLKTIDININYKEYDDVTKNKIDVLKKQISKIEETLEIVSCQDNEVEYEKLEACLPDLYKEFEKLIENK